MKEIFSLRQTDRLIREKYKLCLDIPSYNQVNFGRKALKFFDPKNQNSQMTYAFVGPELELVTWVTAISL